MRTPLPSSDRSQNGWPGALCANMSEITSAWFIGVKSWVIALTKNSQAAIYFYCGGLDRYPQ